MIKGSQIEMLRQLRRRQLCTLYCAKADFLEQPQYAPCAQLEGTYGHPIQFSLSSAALG